MYNSIIPSLVSFDTNLKKINGFYYSDNFQFYPLSGKKSVFHYKVFIDNNITIPKKYDFRNGYFLKSKNKWYYARKLGCLSLKFCYDPNSKTFSFNRLYALIPFQVGYVFPVGLHIADIINLDLFLSGITSFRGCAYNYNHKNVCVIAPGYSGKTTMLKSIFDKGGKYIAEDILVVDLYKNTVYPSNIRTDIFARKASKNIKNIYIKKLITKSQNISEIFLVQNSTTNNYVCQNKNLFDFLKMCSLSFNTNPFIRSYIFEELLTHKIETKFRSLKQENVKYYFKHIREFNYNFLYKI